MGSQHKRTNSNGYEKPGLNVGILVLWCTNSNNHQICYNKVNISTFLTNTKVTQIFYWLRRKNLSLHYNLHIKLGQHFFKGGPGGGGGVRIARKRCKIFSAPLSLMKLIYTFFRVKHSYYVEYIFNHNAYIKDWLNSPYQIINSIICICILQLRNL